MKGISAYHKHHMAFHWLATQHKHVLSIRKKLLIETWSAFHEGV